jgi:hypothetical protein
VRSWASAGTLGGLSSCMTAFLHARCCDSALDCPSHPVAEASCGTTLARLQMEEQSLIKVKADQEVLVQKLSDSSTGAAYV